MLQINEILKNSDYAISLFSEKEIKSLEKNIIEKVTKTGTALFVNCIIRNKEIKLTLEEVIRQLFTAKLINHYGYPKERIVFEYPIYFGREAKRADIVIKDKDDPNVAYIIIEVKKPKAKDGREQLKSYTHGTGATMAIWTNGEAITFHHRKNPNFFEDIPDIPLESQKLEDILNRPFTMDDLVRDDKLTKTGKSLKQLIEEMEDEVLANAGVDVFEEVFKLIFAKLYDEQLGATDKKRNLEFRNTGLTDIQLKDKIQKLFHRSMEKWDGVFPDDVKNKPHTSSLGYLCFFFRRCKIVQF